MQIGAGGWSSGFSPDNVVTLTYIDPLIFITSTIGTTGAPVEPVSHDNTALRWHIPNSMDAGIVATFNDPRIDTTYLPVVMR
jgi:hypothetical protein